MNDGQLIVGFIRGPHGVAGEFKVESASGYYEHIAQLKEVTLRYGSEEYKCSIESAVEGNGTLYMKAAGIDTPEAVRKYNGWEIVVPRKYAHPLQENEWYFEDLKNCSLIWNDGTAAGTAPAEIVGTITDVLEGGVGYLLEVSLSESCSCISDDVKFSDNAKFVENGEKRTTRTVLVPFNEQFIGKVDVKNGTIQLMHLWILE